MRSITAPSHGASWCSSLVSDSPPSVVGVSASPPASGRSSVSVPNRCYRPVTNIEPSFGSGSIPLQTVT